MRKMLERIVPNMINRDLSNTDPYISDNQFVFLVAHSTICAIEYVVKYAQSAIFHAAITTAVSI